jgi:hypothetical protein
MFSIGGIARNVARRGVRLVQCRSERQDIGLKDGEKEAANFPACFAHDKTDRRHDTES